MLLFQYYSTINSLVLSKVSAEKFPEGGQWKKVQKIAKNNEK